MTHFRNLLFLAIIIGCSFGIYQSAAETAPYTIRIGILGSEADEDYDGALVFKDYVEARANGRVEVDIFTSGQFCSNERECIENMQSGVLDVFMTTIGGMGNIYGPGQVFDLPYVFRDDRVAECVFDGPITDDLRQAVLTEQLGLRLMAVSNTGGWRNFATTGKQIRKPEDLKGLKIRTTSAPIQQELMRQLGANPTPVSWSELYTALATGVVEGTKNGIQDIVGMNFHEHVKFITLDGHAYMGALWWYSDKNWKELPPDIRRQVFDGFQHLKTVTRAIPMRRQIEAYETFREAGGEVYALSPDEKAQFQQATSGMRGWYSEKYGTEWLEKLDTAIATCEQSVDAEFSRGNQ
ncbi:MAG: TRAP transporter substrate-binding protein DctP [Aquisalinus sp.]|nr:TRAP transporter substrate-binding protein DctP [Aquisalinus sp.]